jgi:hypothetical protein
MSAVQFKGDSLELLRSVYRGDYLATHEQIVAAGQCLRFEHPPAVTVDGRSVEEIREQVRLEFFGAGGEDVGDVLIAAIERRRAVAKNPTVPAPEVIPPEPAPARHARRAPVLDGDSVQSADPAPPMSVARAAKPVEPVEPLQPGVDHDLIEVNIPLPHGRWITRFVPRVKS